MKKLNWLMIMMVAILPATFSVSCKSKKKEPAPQEDRRNDPPVVVSPDATLRQSVDDVLRSYSGLTADVKDGVVTLRGSIRQDELAGLMEKIHGLKPRKVENQLTIK